MGLLHLFSHHQGLVLGQCVVLGQCIAQDTTLVRRTTKNCTHRAPALLNQVAQHLIQLLFLHCQKEIQKRFLIRISQSLNLDKIRDKIKIKFLNHPMAIS